MRKESNSYGSKLVKFELKYHVIDPQKMLKMASIYTNFFGKIEFVLRYSGSNHTYKAIRSEMSNVSIELNLVVWIFYLSESMLQLSLLCTHYLLPSLSLTLSENIYGFSCKASAVAVNCILNRTFFDVVAVLQKTIVFPGYH